MKKIIVTTTINAPTPEIRKYDAMKDWDLIVTGDRKTPEYKLERGRFISWDEQVDRYPDLCKLIGPDNTPRGRMIAFLEASREHPDLVASIDDDCMPYWNWPGEVYIRPEGVDALFVECQDLVFDSLIGAFDFPPRGYPPQLIGSRSRYRISGKRPIRPLFQANLWDGQADIDASWRMLGMVNNGTCRSNEPYWSDKFSPVNTQNTMIHGGYLKDYCGESPFVGHVGDIWAGYLFQAHHLGRTVYGPPTVYHSQQRSYESILKDMKDEIFSYEHGMELLEALSEYGPKGITKLPWFPDRALEAIAIYGSYFK